MMTQEVPDTMMYYDNDSLMSYPIMKDDDEVTLYEDDDGFSDVDYDSDVCDARMNDEDEEEDEMWEDEDEDPKIAANIRLNLLREQHKTQLKGLEVLEGKLNWLKKVNQEDFHSTHISTKDYPQLGLKKQQRRKKTVASPPKKSPTKFQPSGIKIRYGNSTFIEMRPRLCRSIKEGKPCRFGDRCIYVHEKPTPIVKKTPPKPHHQSPQRQSPQLQSPQRQPQTSPVKSPVKPEKRYVNKKSFLCRKMFKIQNGDISEVGKCEHKNNCIFAHSWIEVRDKINKDIADFQCRYEKNGGCKNVKIEFASKKDNTGTMRTVRRYENVDGRKCMGIHEKERIKDWIVRTQSQA